MRARVLAWAFGAGLALLSPSLASAQSTGSSIAGSSARLSSPSATPSSGAPAAPPARSTSTARSTSARSTSSTGLGRRLGRPLRRAPPRPPAPPPRESAEPTWPGPQIQLSYDYFKLHDGWGGGDVHAGAVGVFVQMPVPQLRLGVLGELGAREYTLGGDDFLARAGVEIGFQLPELLEPLVPHLSLVVSGGAVVGKRFESTVSYAFGGAGVEIGAALRLVRNLHLTVSFGYHRLEMDGAAFDVFLFRAGLGL